MDKENYDISLNLWPVPAIICDTSAGEILAANEAAAQYGLQRGGLLREIIVAQDTVKTWLLTGDKPTTYQTEIRFDERICSTTAAVRRTDLDGGEVLLIVLTVIKEPGTHEDNAAVAALCETYAGATTNTLRLFLQTSAINLGAYCAVVYEKRKDRYIIRDEWRSRRTVSISILSADFETHPEQEMARIGQLKRAMGLGYAPFVKSYGTRGSTDIFL